MRRRAAPAGAFDFEAFGASVGLAVISGALSVVIPGLLPATAALGALAVAGWAAAYARHRSLPTAPWTVVAAGLAGLLGLVMFLAPPHAFKAYRGLGVGAGLLPLWLVGRARRVVARWVGGAPG